MSKKDPTIGIPLDPEFGPKIVRDSSMEYIPGAFLVPKINKLLPEDKKLIAVNTPVFSWPPQKNEDQFETFEEYLEDQGKNTSTPLICAAWKIEHNCTIEEIMDAASGAFGEETISYEEAQNKYIIEPVIKEVSEKIISGEIPIKFLYMVVITRETNQMTFQPIMKFSVRGSTGVSSLCPKISSVS